jgi:hypothetical protein
VREDQAQRVRLRGTDVQEVQVRAVDRGGELGKLVQPRFMVAPLIAVAPIGSELLEVVERNTAAPANAREFIWPTGACQPLA